MADTKQGFAIRAPDGQGRWALWVAVAAAVTGWATAGYLYVRQQHDGNAKASAATASPKAEPKPAPRVAAPPEPSPVQAPFVAKPAAPKPEEPAAAEPLYRGKPAEYWLTVLRGGDRQARFDALHAFAELPPQSKETLDEILRALEEKDSITRRCAVEALARYGPRAKPALPTLLEYLKAEAIRDDGRSIVKAIGQMGPEAREAVPVLAGRLREHSVSMRDADAVALCQIGGEEGVRIIAERVDIKRFKGEPTDPFVEAIGYGGEAAVPQLLKWLETTMEEDGWPALGPVLRAIARVGTPARDAAPHLEKIAASQKTEVRTLALYALLRAAPERVNAETTIPLLIERLGESKREPDPARLALVWYGEKAVPKLMDAFRKPGDVQRDLILSTFQRMGPRAREAVPLILEEAQGNAHGMRGPALRALGPAGYPPQETVPLLVKSLEDPKARCDAVMALGHLRGAARSAMPALQALLKDPDFNVRTRAENAVNLIKYATDDTTPYVPKEEF